MSTMRDDREQDERRQLLRGLHRRPGDRARDAAHDHRGRPGAVRRALPDPVRDRLAARSSPPPAAWRRHPVEELIAFHVAFGKTVPDISLNAVANLGYAECRFHQPVVPGDTLRTRSEVIGLKQNSNGRTGVVYVRSTAINQRGEIVLDWCRWVMVHKRDADAPAPETVVPDLADARGPGGPGDPRRPRLHGVRLRGRGGAAPPRRLRGRREDRPRRRRHPHRPRAHAGDPAVAEHRQGALQHRRPPRRQAGWSTAATSSRWRARCPSTAWPTPSSSRRSTPASHVAPAFAGDTVYAWSEVLDKAETGRARRRRPAPAPGGHQGPRRVDDAARRRREVRRGRAARPRLLGARSPSEPAPPARAGRSAAPAATPAGSAPSGRRSRSAGCRRPRRR